jgi:BNR repeat protein
MWAVGRIGSMWMYALAVVAIAAATWGASEWRPEYVEQGFEGKAKIRGSGITSPQVIESSPDVPAVILARAPAAGFTPQTRLGFHVDNEWEPAIATDRSGHVYVLYPQYGGVPGCPTCYSPTMILQISSDSGKTWAAPSVIYPEGSTSYQVDAQIVVDPVDGQTVYGAWLQNNKSDIVVAKSTDFGATWIVVTADHTNAGTDKPILAVRGQDVYVSYNHSQTAYVTYSHDGGLTFTEVKMNQNAKLGWSLGSGGTVTPNGRVYFSWEGYEGNGGAKGNVNLYVSTSTDGGATWATKTIDVSSSPPDCSAFNCGWAFLGAAMTMTSDTSGNLYLLWNAGSSAKGPERIYFAKSADGGGTWSARKDVSTAPAGTHHAFPAIAAAGNGDVRIAWMDARAANGGMDRWNVYYRSSANGGSTWSADTDISTFVSGTTYIFSDGFRFPFGDYFEMDIDPAGTAHAVWGEGYDYDSPGSIWYSQGK